MAELPLAELPADTVLHGERDDGLPSIEVPGVSGDPREHARQQIAETLAMRDDPKLPNPVSIVLSGLAATRFLSKRSACDPSTAIFFHAPSYAERKEERLEREARAKAICGGCAVRTDCLEYALRIREPHGVWGGLNEQERKQKLAQRQANG
jgi:WhiB family redox-sensing transcriptional regulator